MKIRPVGFINNNINFQRKGRPRVQYHKVYEPDMFYESPEEYKRNLLRGVPKNSKETMFEVLNECFKYAKEEFPDDKVTLFFTTKQNSRVMNNSIFILSIGINTKAKEGIVRNDEEIPGFTDSIGSKYFNTQAAYSHSGDKLTLEELRAAYLIKFKENISAFKEGLKDGKQITKETEAEKKKDNFFTKFFKKLFKK